MIIRLPWVGSISTHLERKIRTSVRLAYFSVQVYAVYHTSRAFVLPKDKLPTPSLSNVLYFFECRHCESRYVGKTTRHLSDRIKQHVPKHLVEPPQEEKKRGHGRPPKNLTKPAAERYQSAIACHLAGNERCLQAFSCDQFSVLSRAWSACQLHVLEAIFIQRLKPSLCGQKSFMT